MGYDIVKSSRLVRGIRFGFKIPYKGPSRCVSFNNHRSTINFNSALIDKLNSELDKGRIAGPFQECPLNNFHASPLGIIPKKEPNQFRLIHDLSYGDELSVNYHIDKEDTKVSYELLDHVIDIVVNCGRSSLVAKADIENAFRILPINPESYHLLGFKWQNLWYYDKSLPMGLSTSCQIFELFSSSIQWLLQHKLGVRFMSHILDDFIFIGPAGSNECRLSLNKFMAVSEQLNIPIKHSKTVLPTTLVTVHGIEIDTVQMIARLPQEKLQKIQCQLHSLCRLKRVQLQQLQSILGLLNFACKIIAPGRAFLRRLFDLTIGVRSPHHRIRITAEARADIAMWLQFMSEYNGITMLSRQLWITSDKLHLHSDASGSIGFAAILGKYWLQGHWPPEWKSLNITFLELYPIVAAVVTWSPFLKNKCIVFNCDNAAIVFAINAQSSKEPAVMLLIRKLVLFCMLYNIKFKASHVPGTQNVLADKLSRSQVQEALVIAPWLHSAPTGIPESIHPDSIPIKRSWLRRSLLHQR